MAKYSFTTYGIPKYGELENNRVYYNVNLRAWSYDYETISLAWGSVTSDPADSIVASVVFYTITDNLATFTTSEPHNFIENLPVIINGIDETINGQYVIATIVSDTEFTCIIQAPNTSGTVLLVDPGSATVGRPTHWKIIKSFSGAPNDPYEGIFVDGDLITNYRLSYIDSQTLDEGLEVTYSFWIFNGIRWINCGDARAIFVDETDTLNKISKWIPRAWLNAPGDATGEPEDGYFYNTLSAYAFEYDKLNTEAQLLEKSSDYKYTPASTLRYKITDLGFTFEPSLGDIYHRALLGAGNIVNSVKGTSAAVNTYTTALTHWSNEVVVGHNLFLDYNDSSFEESVGRWRPATGLFDFHLYANSVADFGTEVTPPNPGLYDLLFPPRTKGFARASGHSGTAQSIVYPSVAVAGVMPTPVLYGVPIKPNTRYIFSGWTRLRATQHIGTVKARIDWYDKAGTLISSTDYGTTLNLTTLNWVEFTTPSDAGRNGKVSPATAAYAGMTVVFTPNNNSSQAFFDMFQICETQYSLEYQDARLVQVVVRGKKENLIPNPAFDGGIGGWYSLNGTLSQDFNPPASSIIYGNSVAKLTATSDQDRVAIVSDWIPVDPGKSYTFSAYISGTAHNAIARIEYSVQQSADEQTTILTDEDGKFYPPTPYIVDSEPLPLTSVAERISVSSISPIYTTDSGSPLAKVAVYIDTADIDDEFYFDAFLFEQNDTEDAFFAGDGAPIPQNPITETFFFIDDCRWETKNRINFVPNPSLETTTSWVAGDGTTLTSVVADALFGAKQGQVSKAGGGSVSTTAYLPVAAIGGEDVVVSAYVKNKAGTYSIRTAGQEVPQFIVETSNKDEWTRIHAKRILAPGETSFDLTISLNTGNSAAAVFYFDGVQAEYGRISTQFVDPAIPEVITRPNLLNPAVNMYLTKSESRDGGKSLYWPTYADKYIRLFETLGSVLPNGSTWAIRPGKSEIGYPELEESLIPSASFENDLGEWEGIDATLARAVPRGTLFDETCTHGTAFCRVISTADTEFGITYDQIAVDSGDGYYASVAIRPENVDAYGVYNLTITFYDEFDVSVVTRTDTAQVRRSDRWAYFATYATSLETLGAVRATITVTAETDTPAAGHVFHIDRVVFRQ